eukprot:18973-Amphidinium_carterae.1
MKLGDDIGPAALLEPNHTMIGWQTVNATMLFLKANQIQTQTLRTSPRQNWRNSGGARRRSSFR